MRPAARQGAVFEKLKRDAAREEEDDADPYGMMPSDDDEP